MSGVQEKNRCELVEKAYGIFYDELTDETKFDESYFKSLHRRTFESLYDWAGKYRTFNMSKRESRFCQGAYVASESKQIFRELEEADTKKLEEIILKGLKR